MSLSIKLSSGVCIKIYRLFRKKGLVKRGVKKNNVLINYFSYDRTKHRSFNYVGLMRDCRYALSLSQSLI